MTSEIVEPKTEVSLAKRATRDAVPPPKRDTAPRALDRNAFEPDSWEQMVWVAKQLFDSGLVPQSLKTPQAVMTVIWLGRDLGIPTMQALTNIHVVKGKPFIGAHLLHALVLRSGLAKVFRIVETTDARCEIQAQRHEEWDPITSFVWTIDRAKKAGLIRDDGGWKTYPENMLRARAISDAARAKFPEVVGGYYVPEEIDDSDGTAATTTAVSPSPQPASLLEAISAAEDRYAGGGGAPPAPSPAQPDLLGGAS